MQVVFVDHPDAQGDTIVSGINGKGTIVGWSGSGTPYGYGLAFIGTPLP